MVTEMATETAAEMATAEQNELAQHHLGLEHTWENVEEEEEEELLDGVQDSGLELEKEEEHLENHQEWTQRAGGVKWKVQVLDRTENETPSR